VEFKKQLVGFIALLKDHVRLERKDFFPFHTNDEKAQHYLKPGGYILLRVYKLFKTVIRQSTDTQNVFFFIILIFKIGFTVRMKQIEKQLRTILAGKVTIVGIGNRLRGDDGAGPLVIDAIGGISRVSCIDAGVAPENYLEKIVKTQPETVLFIDAINFNGDPGEVRIFNPEEIAAGGLSTHALSVVMVCEYMKNRLPVRIFIIGIQPVQLSLGEELSVPVVQAVEQIKVIIHKWSNGMME